MSLFTLRSLSVCGQTILAMDQCSQMIKKFVVMQTLTLQESTNQLKKTAGNVYIDIAIEIFPIFLGICLGKISTYESCFDHRLLRTVQTS